MSLSTHASGHYYIVSTTDKELCHATACGKHEYLVGTKLLATVE